MKIVASIFVDDPDEGIVQLHTFETSAYDFYKQVPSFVLALRRSLLLSKISKKLDFS